MSVYFGNQKAKQLVYVDANGVQHNVKEAYLGSQLVFSGKKKGFTITSQYNRTLSYNYNGGGSANERPITLVANVPLFVEVDGLTSMSQMFSFGQNGSVIIALDVSGLDTSNVTDMKYCFQNLNSITSLDLSNFDTSKVTNMSNMFYGCSKLESLDLSKFDVSKVTSMSYMFDNCKALTHIKCKQAFKDWCWANATTIKLPTAMQSGGSGTWEIVG